MPRALFISSTVILPAFVSSAPAPTSNVVIIKNSILNVKKYFFIFFSLLINLLIKILFRHLSFITTFFYPSNLLYPQTIFFYLVSDHPFGYAELSRRPCHDPTALLQGADYLLPLHLFNPVSESIHRISHTPYISRTVPDDN